VTPEQREAIVNNRVGGAKLLDCAKMARVPVEAFRSDYAAGRNDFSRGKDTPEAKFYCDMAEAASVYVSNLRAQAEATAGARISSDLMKLVEDFESEAEPLAHEEESGRAPSLRIHDDLEAHKRGGGDLTDEEAADVAAKFEAFQRAGLEAFNAMMDVEARRREERRAAEAATGRD